MKWIYGLLLALGFLVAGFGPFAFWKPVYLPSLDLDFSACTFPASLTFSRASAATYVNSSGLIADSASGSARLTYDPVSLTCLGLMVEGARTNKALYNEQFDDATWTKSNATIVANSTTSPDGNATAEKFVEGSTTSTHYVEQSATSLTTSTSVVFSFFVKANGRSWIAVEAKKYNNATNIAYFNLGSGAVGTSSFGRQGIQSFSNGWYRVWTQFNSNTGAGSPWVRVHSATADSTNSYAGDGASGFYIWGAQFEESNIPTSLIRTTSASASRVLETVYLNTSSSWLNNNAGTFVVDGRISDAWVQLRTLVSLSDGTAANEILFSINTSGAPRMAENVSSVSQYNQAGTNLATLGTSFTVAGTYSSSTIKVAKAGVVDTATGTYSVPFSISRLNIGSEGDGTTVLVGTIKRMRYYSTNLPDDELKSLAP